MNPHAHRRRQKPAAYPHGQTRRADRAPQARATGHKLGDTRTRGRRTTPTGTVLLLFVCVGMLVAVGMARVRSTTAVLEAGAEIAELSDQQARLLEHKRRLSAERAYLRHPEQVLAVARDQLGMIPVAPELVQTIRIRTERPSP